MEMKVGKGLERGWPVNFTIQREKFWGLGFRETVASGFRLWLEMAAEQAMDGVDVAQEGCGVNGVYTERERERAASN